MTVTPRFLVYLILVAGSPFVPCTAHADDNAETPDKVGLQVGASGGIALPFIGFTNDYTGALNFSGDVDMGGGGTLHANYFLTRWFAVGANVGVFHFPGSSVDTPLGSVTAPSINVIPLTFSLGLFPQFGGNDKSLRPHFGVDVGAYVITNDAVATQAYVGFAPVLGSGYRITDRVKLVGDTRFHVILDKSRDFGFIGYIDVTLGVMVTL
ncbi:MAG: hypothetical protein NT062_16955 [Proteobacteria bacterium]|nr:hypothetical protein [Pseudomonadota bacterium]